MTPNRAHLFLIQAHKICITTTSNPQSQGGIESNIHPYWGQQVLETVMQISNRLPNARKPNRGEICSMANHFGRTRMKRRLLFFATEFR